MTPPATQQPQVSVPRIGIYGTGRVGQTLAVALSRAGYSVAAVGSRSAGSVATAAALLAAEGRQAAVCSSLGEVAARCEVLFVTVTDDALAAIPAMLGREELAREDLLLVHTSGAFPASVLLPEGQPGACRVGGFHPMCSFASVEAGLRNLPGSTIGVEATSEADQQLLSGMARALGGVPLLLAGEGKVFYHAAACMASNYTCVLLDGALRVLREAGVDEAAGRAALVALVSGTLRNIAGQGPVEALTGPIARGDASTIQRHVQALEDSPGLPLYRDLGRYCVELATRRAGAGQLDPEQARHIMQLLGDNPSQSPQQKEEPAHE